MSKNPKFFVKLKILGRSLGISFVSVIIISLALIALNFLSKNWIDIIGKIPINIKQETYSSVRILILFYLISLPFSLIGSAFIGFQKYYVENGFNILWNFINFMVLILVVYFEGDLVFYSWLWGTALLTFNLIKLIYFYVNIYKKTKHELNDISSTDHKDTDYYIIFSTGMRFFVIGIASTIVWNTDLFVISNFISIDSVVSYSITFKLFSVVFGIIFQLNNAIIPLLGKEFGEGKMRSVNHIYSNFLILIAVVGGSTWIGSTLFFRDLIFLWTGPEGFAGLIVVLALGGYSYLLGMSVLNAGVVNSLDFSSYTPLVAWGEAGLKLFLSIYLGQIWGLSGIAMGTFLGSLFTQSLFLPLLILKGSRRELSYEFLFLIKHFFFALIPCLFSSVLVVLFCTSLPLRISLGLLVLTLYFYFSIRTLNKVNRSFYQALLVKLLGRLAIRIS